MINPGGLTESDKGALNEEQRVKLRQLKVDVEKLDQKYIRVCLQFCWQSSDYIFRNIPSST